MTFRPKILCTLLLTTGLMLSACENAAEAQKASRDPVPLHQADHQVEAQIQVTQDVREEMPEKMSEATAEDGKIAALERKVAALENEASANRPKIAKIDIIEQKFKELSLGLDRIDAAYNMKPDAAPAAAPAAPARDVQPKTGQPKPAHKINGKIVSGLRVGDQKGVSRLVLDMGESRKPVYDIDNDEKILTIDIPGFTWNGPAKGTLPHSPLIASYDAQSDAKGAHVMVQLKKPVKIVKSASIGPTADKQARAVLDISAR